MENRDFGKEVAKILPRLLIEFAKRQKDVFSKTPLTIPQVVILEFLQEHGPCKMSELAQTLNLTMSAVTAIIDKMIKQKLVKRERSSEDRRVVRVIMLNKGKETISRVRQARCACVNELFSTLTDRDKDEYLRILNKAYTNLKQRQ